MEPKKCTGLRKLIVLFATGFGLGYSPVASGTVGTIPGVLISVLLASYNLAWQVIAVILLALVAVPGCSLAEKYFGIKDDRHIVADEFLTFPICMLGLPPEPWMLAIAFLTNRLFDVIKPPPARKLQVLPGGLGITIDDVISSLYSLLANHIIYRIIC